MRVAVLSDIHGFSNALDTVLSDLDATGPYDAIVVAGDLCELGPDPVGVLETLQARGLTAIQGNTDRDIVEAFAGAFESEELDYAVRELGSDGVSILSRLPFSHRITPPGGTSPVDDMLIVHANPQNLEDPMKPDMTDAELQSVIGDTEAAAIVFGHFHVCYQRSINDLLLVDVSAVGNPKDGDLRCKYGVLSWDRASNRWSAELRRLVYPLEETEAQMRASGMPNAEKAIRKLRRATYRYR